MNVVEYSKNGLSEIKNRNKVIIRIDDSLFSTHTIINKNISLSQAKKSIPFNLEAELLDNIDDLEFFIKKTGDVFNVITISKKILSDLKRNIKEKKLEVIGAYLSFMFLSKIEGKVTYIEDGDNVIFRTAEFEGGSVNKNLFHQLFDENSIIFSDTRSQDYQKINLLTYNFSEINSKFIKPYVSVAVLLFTILLTTVAFYIVENNKMSSELKTIVLNNKMLFKSLFPNEEVVDIRVQTEQKMSYISTQKDLEKNDFLTQLLNAQLTDKKINSLVLVTDKILEIK